MQFYKLLLQKEIFLILQIQFFIIIKGAIFNFIAFLFLFILSI